MLSLHHSDTHYYHTIKSRFRSVCSGELESTEACFYSTDNRGPNASYLSTTKWFL